MKPFFFFLALIAGQLSSAQDSYFPPNNGNTWDTISPTSLGWCEDSITALYDYLELENSKSFILLKDGKIVLEQYFGTYTQDSSFLWFSAAKSLRAMLIGKAQEEGFLAITDKTSDYIGSNWTSLNLPQEDSITIWHQLTMTSGLDESNFTCENPNCLTYVSTAGTRWAYHNGPYGLLRAVLENATGTTQNLYTNSRIKTPIGMGGFWINLLGINTYYSKARDMARYGLLVSNKGIWDNDTILADSNYLQQMISPSQSLNPSYGYLWWLNGQNGYVTTGTPTYINGFVSPDAPSDVYTAAGSQGQYISISPNNGLVMIRQGNTGSSSYTEFGLHNEIWKRIMNLSCTTSNLQKHNLTTAFSVYPNPTKDVLYINYSGMATVLIYDIYGQLMLRTVEKKILTSNLPKGTYILKAITANGSHTQSFIKD
ncbi:MAG: serine hydrolase [Flavobacteriales bacterium]|jgi:CubicO group peptidase (beta-lactamase class C family)|nr:serine hydrolase [Flavobacteriales bacterium]